MSSDETQAKPNLTILLVDESTEDRMQLETLLTSVGVVHAAAIPAEAAKVAESLDSIDVMVAGIPSNDGGSIFSLRDDLVEKFGELPVAFCSREDMSPYYDQVKAGENLFYKPVDDQVLRKWLAEATGVAAESVLPPTADFTGPVNPGAPAALPDELLEPDTILGDYKLLRLIQNDENFAMYEAEQASINRRVALKILYRKHRRDPNWVGGFAEEARARALVTHPDVSLVYEADQERGVTFYTLELIEGNNLSSLAAKGALLDETTLWRILKSCGSAISYLKANQMQFRPLSADTLFLVNDGHPRIANPVKAGSAVPTDDDSDQMRLIAEAVRPFLMPPGKADPRLASVIDRLANPARVDGIKSARGLVEAIRRAEEDALGAGPPIVLEERGNRRAIVIGVLIGSLIVAGLIIAYLLSGGNRPVAKDFERMVLIPEGPFVYQKDERMELPAFWIDEHEVSIAQYAVFLADLKAHPEKLKELRDERQPEEKTSYAPTDWIEIYDAAVRGRSFRGAPIDLNCPVMEIDWWDANAYAIWKGNRLPTEQEWEKAGRGRSGSVFPWGDEIAMEKFNSGADREGEGAGKTDGYKYWAPVDAHPEDDSRYGVKGLAGNVSEWTATWSTHPDHPDRQVPIKRGASFNTTEGYELTGRRPAETPEEAGFSTGFRTARSTPPPPAKEEAKSVPDSEDAPKVDDGSESKSMTEPAGDTSPEGPASDEPATDTAAPTGEPATGEEETPDSES